jgi:diguanylate cyclase (GGDEF)-like protein
VHPADRSLYTNHENRLIEADDDEVVQSDFRMADSTGLWKWISFRSIVFQRNHEQKPKLVLYVGQDITALKETEEKLRYMSIHDQLTSLYNRLYFEEEMARLERGRIFPVSVIMADLDDLKTVNDRYGHHKGDELLQESASLFRSCFRSEDVVARIGGDEFAALLPGADEVSSEKVVERINIRFNGQNSNPDLPTPGISVGVCTIQRGGSLVEALKQADARMYTSKQSRKQKNHLATPK